MTKNNTRNGNDDAFNDQTPDSTYSTPVAKDHLNESLCVCVSTVASL